MPPCTKHATQPEAAPTGEGIQWANNTEAATVQDMAMAMVLHRHIMYVCMVLCHRAVPLLVRVVLMMRHQ